MLTTPGKINQLGWSEVETAETHLRVRSFAEDWDAPGMEAYDKTECMPPIVFEPLPKRII